MNRIKNISAYVSNVTDLLWNYIKHNAAYPKNAVLAVQREIRETVIENPDDCRDCDFYDLKAFIRKTPDGRMQPNLVAIQTLAYRFYKPNS